MSISQIDETLLIVKAPLLSLLLAIIYKLSKCWLCYLNLRTNGRINLIAEILKYGVLIFINLMLIGFLVYGTAMFLEKYPDIPDIIAFKLRNIPHHITYWVNELRNEVELYKKLN